VKERFRVRVAPALLAALLLAACRSSVPDYPVLQAEADAVFVPLTRIVPGSGRFFSYRPAGGGRTDFLVYRESTGEPRAVLNACREFYRWKQGYALEGDRVVCRKCGMAFRFDVLAQGTGSCMPVPLSTRVEAGRLRVPVEELDAGARYF
jgi:uncharacterized membrane protein